MIKSKLSKAPSDAAARMLCAAVGAVATLTAAPAMAQDSTVDEIVITGTSIRGAAPVGANVIAVDRRTIERSGAQTVQQLLTRIPQVAGFNNTGQWAFGSNDASGTHAPTIHSLGASASNSTLILIDGRRLPLSGLNHNLADPNVIAPSALERVEVLPDGASAVYGSDALAGVLNFITRRNLDGVETSTQRGFGDGYDTTDASVAAGKPWDGGSVFVTYAYTYRDNVSDNDRPFVRMDLRTLGGNNFGSFNCTPAAIQPGAGQPGAGQRFLSPYATGTGMAATVNPCDVRAATKYDIVPDETRHRVLAKIEQRVTDNLTASAEFVYSSRINKFRGPYTPGAIRNLTAITVYGPGSAPPGGAGQINPFFRGPPGVTTETIFVNFDPIFGQQQFSKSSAETRFATFGLDYRFAGDWAARLEAVTGRDVAQIRQVGALCQPCALLALNGAGSAAGVPGAGVTQLPLTTANAVDVWSPIGQNLTSAAVLQALMDNSMRQRSRQNIKDVKLVLDGPLLAVPGGEVRASMGAEGIWYGMRQVSVGQSVLTTQIDYSRNVNAVFGEVIFPVIGDANAMPFLQRFDLSAAVRYDDYSDFGSTTNPKFAFDLSLTDDIHLRGSYGSSFTAPALSSRGDANGVSAESMYAASAEQVVPTSFPGVAGLPGCNPVPATGCRIGGTNPAQGIQISGGNKSLKPSEGDTFSLGADLTPRFLPGFKASVTWWRARVDGMITAPSFAAVTTNPPLFEALLINPTAAQVTEATRYLRATTVIPANVSFIYSFQQRNAFDLDASGIDVDVSYLKTTDRAGDFTINVTFSDKLTFKQRTSSAVPWSNNLNTAGVNASFSSIEFYGRAGLGWSLGGFDTGLFVNHTKGYWARTANNLALFGAKGQPVSSHTTFDAHMSYAFEDGGALEGLQLFATAENFLDKDPPYVNISGGYNDQEASPIGRVLYVGLRKTW
jgi:iron complex outermembrane receptor protein